MFYETRCWRYEKPQAGRYREFTQLGIEILNPKKATSLDDLIELADRMAARLLDGIDYQLDRGATRGLAYYTDAKGFEIRVDGLGAQKQVLGGGAYAEGMGFAFGLDRIVLARESLANTGGVK